MTGIIITVINYRIHTALSVCMQMKTPPDRAGITFEVGAQLEARDRLKNWYEPCHPFRPVWCSPLCNIIENCLPSFRYAATIEKIDFDKERVLIHFRRWSRRHNEWFHWNSPYLRPLERISLRRQGQNPPHSQPVPLVHKHFSSYEKLAKI